MKKQELLQLLDKQELIRLYKSERLVDDMIAVDLQMQKIFIERLPDELSAYEIIKNWSHNWKKFSSNGFVEILEKITYQEFKKISDLPTLINYWYANANSHFRAVIRRIVLELLPTQRIALTAEIIRALYFIIYIKEN